MSHALLLLLLLLTLAPSNAASLAFTLDSPVQTAPPGTVLPFSGTLVNLDTSDLYLNSLVDSFLFPDLVIDYTVFLTIVPPSLAPGASYSGPLFDVVIGAAALPGDYAGSITIQGGPDIFTFQELAAQGFIVKVAEVPEPLPAGMALAGCVIAFARRRLRKENDITRLPRTTNRRDRVDAIP